MATSSLAPGTRLGPYEVIELVGIGGMGEVYKARDGRLGRVVAVKVLAQPVAGDADRRARFAREARAIASLDHPNICAVYDVGESDGAHFIVMQYLEGQTLADRLRRGSLPLEHVLRVGVEIADALDKAHRAAMVHRDLKPANIMLTSGGAKLLDFGLAKLREPVGPIGMSTLTRLGEPDLTGEGTILGTMHYMAPEQVEGREADSRSDIFALGAVLYEAATGKRPFIGTSSAAVIGAILKDDPLPLSNHRPTLPPALDQLVQACLAKEPDDRWQSAADVKRQLSWLATSRSGSGSAVSLAPPGRWPRSSWRIAAAVLATALVLVLPAAWRQWRAAPPVLQAVRFEIGPPDRTTFAADVAQVPSTQMAVSPDGRRIAFVAASPGARPVLWVRALDATPQMLAGTENASYPFWSADSQSLGFFTQNKLKRVDLSGGMPQTLGDVDIDARGGTWNGDGLIVFATNTRSGLSQVLAGGGAVTPLLNLRPGENSYRWPSFLPDGRHFLFHIRGSAGRGVYLGSIDSEVVTPMLTDAPYGATFSSGYLLTMRDGTLVGYPFDEKQLRITGEPVRVADNVGGSTTLRASFSSSPTGVLAYAGPLTTPGRLVWVDRKGTPVGAPTEVGDYLNFRISPDGRRVALTRVEQKSSTTDIWILDGERNVQTRFTSDPGTDTSPVWSPDGSRIMFRSDRAGGNFPFERPSAGDTPERLLAKVETLFLTDWSQDGESLAFHGNASGSSYDVGVVTLAALSAARFLARTTATEIDGRFSPSGKWIAYSSDDSGQMEVYVAPFPRAGGRVVSTGGGSEPHWSGDGRELFYLAADRSIMAVAVGPDTTGTFGVPKPLFPTGVLFPGSMYRMNFDVNRDGTRFLVSTPIDGAGQSPITVIVNWQAGHKK